ncbi:hypothetical protein TEA_004131 [Camellia sinensis var. sinensis]|uniref:TBCC domain-containing protein 1 n=1 Tax=Camellia sinensis var. sinensis TaxID=542762 RepID=A0A4S4EVX9_CAMSN|nr:hypothetical protein TEA_004131 [Camellia sinensis var. sinensis]
MPAAPVSATLVYDWLLQKISSALEHISEIDVAMADACVSSIKALTSARGPSFIEGISKSSYVKHASDLKGSSVKLVPVDGSDLSKLLKPTYPAILDFIGWVMYWAPIDGLRLFIVVHGLCGPVHVSSPPFPSAASVQRREYVINCLESIIYILAPLRYATIYGCSGTSIVVGAVGKAVRVEHCERVHVIIAAKRICIANCRECVFFLGVNQWPLIVGDNHKLQVAPYNTFYSKLEALDQVGIEATINRWDDPVALGIVDPHDSLSHPAGVSDVHAESATRLDSD